MFLATHGVLRRSSAFVPPVFADTYSFEYDGVSDYLIADIDGTSTGVVLPSSDSDVELSISLWFKATSLPSSAKGIFQWGNLLSDGSPFFLLQVLGSGNIRVAVDGGYRLTQSISTGVWYNFVTTRTASNNTWTFYLNGSSVGTRDDGGTISNRSSALSFYLGNGYNGYFNGKIDEPAIFDYALTSTEVSNIYGSGVPTDISSLNPVGWWREENGSWDGSKWTITDSGSGGNDAESVSMTSTSRTSDVPT